MRILKAFIAAVFLGLLILPGVQMATGFIKHRPLDENRTRAPAPQWRGLKHVGSYTEAAQKWFEDRYGLRDLLIRSKTQIDYSVFHYSDKIHLGADGWLFYRSVIDREEPAVDRLSDAEQDKAIAGLERLRDTLAAKGVTLVVVSNQLADTFYPEYLPATAWAALHRTRFNDFRARLHRLEGVPYLDTTETLMPLKQQFQIFHKTDFHWNDPAAAVLAGKLVDMIAGLEGRPLPFWHDRTRIVTRRFSGGEATFMPLFRPPTEDGLFLERTEPMRVDAAKAPPPFESSWTAKPGVTGLLPPIVVYGDSFFDGMDRAGIYDHFEASLRARTYTMPIEEAARLTPPGTKYFILQFIEVVLPYLTKLPPPTPRLH